MGKRSDFERKPRDFYPTPYEAVVPLIPHLDKTTYWEPCVGDGALVRHLARNGMCYGGGSDIDLVYDVDTLVDDARTHQRYAGIGQFITNPPWDRPVLHAIIDNLRVQAPTWLLIDADWAHTRQAKPYLQYCKKIVAVGRVKWIANSKYTGKDNCCWYLFGDTLTETIFIGR